MTILGSHSSEPFPHRLLRAAIVMGVTDVVASLVSQRVSISDFAKGLYPFEEPFPDRFLHAAIEEGEIDIVASLISQGVSLSTLVEEISPLHRACESGKKERIIRKVGLTTGIN